MEYKTRHGRAFWFLHCIRLSSIANEEQNLRMKTCIPHLFSRVISLSLVL